MGNCCTPTQLEKTPQQELTNQEPETSSTHETDLAKAAVKIQSRFRGNVARNQTYAPAKVEAEPKVGAQPQPAQHGPSSNLAVVVNVMPNYSNPKTQEALNTLDPFIYDKDEPSDANLPYLAPYEFVGNRTIYKGQWDNGIRSGRGEQYWPDGSQYHGYWRNNQRNGKGRMIYANGDVYEGNFVDSKEHGLGFESYSDGGRFEGEFDQGLKHGRGVTKWPDGSSYEGEYKDDKMNGYGVYKWSDGKIFRGNWKDDKKHGKGELLWPDGRKYIGEYNYDEKHGYGEFNMADGTTYKGEWRNGVQHGRGTAFDDETGRERVGEWEGGKRIKWV